MEMSEVKMHFVVAPSSKYLISWLFLFCRVKHTSIVNVTNLSHSFEWISQSSSQFGLNGSLPNQSKLDCYLFVYFNCASSNQMIRKVVVNPLVINSIHLKDLHRRNKCSDLLHLFKPTTYKHPHLYTHANILHMTRNDSNRPIVEYKLNYFRLCNTEGSVITLVYFVKSTQVML